MPERRRQRRWRRFRVRGETIEASRAGWACAEAAGNASERPDAIGPLYVAPLLARNVTLPPAEVVSLQGGSPTHPLEFSWTSWHGSSIWRLVER